MSVQKNRLDKQVSFSVVPNKVSQGLRKNLQALGLYNYLFSMPIGWFFYNSHIQKECGIGKNLLNKLFKILENHGLLERKQNRDESGKFLHNDFTVFDGNSFKINPQLQNGAPVAGHRQKAPINKYIEINKKKINTTNEKKLSTVKILPKSSLPNKSQEPALRSSKSTGHTWPKSKEWGPGHPSYDENMSFKRNLKGVRSIKSKNTSKDS